MMNQMYPQQPYYGADPMMMYGVQPQVGPMYQQQQVSFTNPLGEKRIQEKLKNGTGEPKLQITQDDMDQAICTHRNGNQSALYELPDGKMKCRICGAEFHLLDNITPEDIDNATENLHDIMHSAKVLWVDVSDQIARENFQVLAVVDQVPMIYRIASNRFQKYAGYNPTVQQQQGINGFNTLNAITGGGMNAGMYYPNMVQPAYQAPVNYPYNTQQPMGYGMPQQPVPMTPMQQQMTANAPGQSNGFGYAQPAAVNVQPTPVVQPTPDQAQQQAAPPAPDNNGGAQVTQTLHV